MMTKQTIFLVDDETTNLAIGKKALSNLYHVYTFNSAGALFTGLNKVRPDLILLDIHMPDISGHLALRQLKSNAETTDIPVMFLTASQNKDDEIKGLQLGAVDFIMKPFSVELLQHRIQQYLTTQSLTAYLAKELEERVRIIIELKNAVISTMAELVEYRDEITSNHIERVKTYIEILINGLKTYQVYPDQISKLNLDMVVQSSQLHDIGKMGVPESILFKQGKLTKQEFEKMKQHTLFGETVISRIKEKTTDNDFLNYATIFALSHHEKWDGSGYPHGLRGEEIPLLGRLMALVDVYDALTTKRTYKEAMSHADAVSIILADAGVHFDPQLIYVFELIHTQFEAISKKLIANKN